MVFEYVLLWGYFIFSIYGVQVNRDLGNDGMVILWYISLVVMMFALPVLTWMMGDIYF